ALDLRRSDTLILRHCGTRRTTVLTRTTTWGNAWYGGGRVTWIDRRRVRSYENAPGPRRSWAPPGAPHRHPGVVTPRSPVFIDKLTRAFGAHRLGIGP